MSPILDLDQIQTYADGLDHSEGICLAPDGLVYVGGEAGQVYRVVEGQPAEEIGRIPGFCLGLAADAENRLYICDHQSAAVWRFDIGTGAVERFCVGSQERKMRVPNWGCFSSAGDYYVSDSGGWGACDGLVWRVRSGVAEPWCETARNFPNGMALAADEQTLYVLESNPAALVSIPILPDGSAGERQLIAELPGTVPDGVAVTTDGRFVIACYRPDAILLVSASGQVETLAEDPKGTVLAAPTNVTFIGPSRDIMVVPNLGRWHMSKFGLPGLVGIPLAYPSREAIGS